MALKERIQPGIHYYLAVSAPISILGGKPSIDEQASDIPDPVARLRYLRQAMEMPAVVVRTIPSRQRKLPWQGISRIQRFPLKRKALVAAVVLIVALTPRPSGTAETLARERGLAIGRPESPMVPVPPVRKIWRVEQTDLMDVYSNGLRVDRTFSVSNRPRAAYPVFPLTGGSTPSDTRSTPVGIVFHSSESLLAPFDEQDNRRLKQLGRNLLEVVRQERAYHYVIDRFGRVFSVVAETDAANHAGHSVWADADGIYVNLNDSFLAISFEGQSGAVDEITPAQIASAKVLTEMLRSKYDIAAENCVTHGQVSVNPLNMRIGSHTDWGGSFPFSAVGLPDNYSIPLASLWAFGFEFDDAFIERTNGFKGVYLAVDQVERQAALENTTPKRFRAMLQHRYKEIAAALTEEKETEGDNR